MSDMIHYNFSTNHQHLGDIDTHISGIHHAKDEINSLFKVLKGIYTGEGATAMQDAHNNIDSMLDDVLQDMAITQQQAQEQQHAMQALDAQNAAAF